MENGTQGVVKYQQANGSRVAKDAEIARIYPDEETVSAAEQADKLDEQIQQLTAVQSPGAALESNISVINQQLFHTYQNFLTSLDFDPVSYTHLDVYKRQVYVLFVVVGATTNLGLIWSISDSLNGMMAIPNIIAVTALSSVAVSYTHLDVYKRQI